MKNGKKSTYCEHCGDFHDPYREYVSMVRVGENIPDFEFETLATSETKLMKLSDFRGKWLVMAFYPTDFSGVCESELSELAAHYQDFQKAGAEVLTVSTDSAFTHQAWKAATPSLAKAGFPMAADPSGKVAYAFGVLVEGEETEYLQDEGLALRGTFIVDPTGVLRSMEILPGNIARDTKETLRKLKAAQFTDEKEGNTCPAGWEAS